MTTVGIENRSDHASETGIGTIDMKVEVIVIPVADVDRSEQFFTPHGSPCSIQFGKSLTSAAPGSAQRTYVIVSDIQVARDALIAAGIEVGKIFHLGAHGPANGLDPERGTYRSLALFSDPDGNTWLLQEITTRLPGRIDSGVTSFSSVTDLIGALRRAEAAHGEHEKRTGVRDANWADWYAAYMAAEQSGNELPT
jgi:catechol 2,3-dioxygenase-like lactoylglutathione lyase family enzyme